MTGNTLDRAPDTISADGGVIAWILNTYFQKPKPAKKKRAGVKPAEPLNEDELLQKAKGAKEGGAFTDLWEGRWQGKYESQSEADSALCCHLAFWSVKNREQMDRLFRRSALFRDKWDAKHHADGATYGEETLNNAIDITESTYGAVSESFAFEQDGRYYSNRSGKVYPMRNTSESPNGAVESTLSRILTENAPAKYSLSAKACQGILRRASVRGKELPQMLRVALERQAAA